MFPMSAHRLLLKRAAKDISVNGSDNISTLTTKPKEMPSGVTGVTGVSFSCLLVKKCLYDV